MVLPAWATPTPTSAGRWTVSTTPPWPRRRPPSTPRLAAVVRTFLESAGYTTIVGAGATQPADDLLTHDAIERGLIPACDHPERADDRH